MEKKKTVKSYYVFSTLLLLYFDNCMFLFKSVFLFRDKNCVGENELFFNFFLFSKAPQQLLK